MQKILVESRGGQLEGVHIPAFELRSGEVLKVACAFGGSEEELVFIDAVTGILPSSVIHTNEKVKYATKPSFRRALFRSMYTGSIIYSYMAKIFPSFVRVMPWEYYMFMATHRNELLRPVYISSYAAKRLLKVISYRNIDTLNNIAGNDKTLLSVKIAWRQADVIIFSMMGCDAEGEKFVDELVSNEISKGDRAAIEICQIDSFRYDQDAIVITKV